MLRPRPWKGRLVIWQSTFSFDMPMQTQQNLPNSKSENDRDKNLAGDILVFAFLARHMAAQQSVSS